MKTDAPLTFGIYVMDETDPRLEGIRLGLQAAAELTHGMIPPKPHNTERGFAASRSSGYRAALEIASARILRITPSDVLKKGKS